MLKIKNLKEVMESVKRVTGAKSYVLYICDSELPCADAKAGRQCIGGHQWEFASDGMSDHDRADALWSVISSRMNLRPQYQDACFDTVIKKVVVHHLMKASDSIKKAIPTFQENAPLADKILVQSTIDRYSKIVEEFLAEVSNNVLKSENVLTEGFDLHYKSDTNVKK